MNKVLLFGRLGVDPEYKQVGANKTSLCRLSLATSENKKDRDGNWQQQTEWHTVVVWGKQAERCKDLRKGQKVLVEGQIKSREFEDKNGARRKLTEVLGRYVVPGGDEQRQRQQSRPEPRQEPRQEQRQQSRQQPVLEDEDPFGLGDDLPF